MSPLSNLVCPPVSPSAVASVLAARPRNGVLARVSALAYPLAVAVALAITPRAQDIELTSFLSGAFVQPPTPSSAYGSTSVRYTPETNTLHCNLSLVGMNATLGHLHQGPPSANTPPLFTLSGSGSFLGGTFVIASAQALDLLSGNFYIDAHSNAFQNGEVRGALRPQRYMHAELSGANVVPPVATNASARAWCVLDVSSGALTIAVAVQGTTPSAVHWRRGAPGTNGPLIAPLSGSGSYWAVLTAPLALADRIDLLRSRTYLEVVGPSPQGALLRDQVLMGGLNPNGEQISASRGGRIDFRLETGFAQGGQPYFVLGSLSGTNPGLNVNGLLLPLNADAYFASTLVAPNQAPLWNSFSFLSVFGQGQAAFVIAPGAANAFVGLTGHHALAAIDLFGSGLVSFTSNSVPLTILP